MELYRLFELAANGFRQRFMRRVWAGGRKLKGLVRQRVAEVLLYKIKPIVVLDLSTDTLEFFNKR